MKVVVTSVPDLENIQNVVLRLSRLNEIVTLFMLIISPVDGQTFVRHGPWMRSIRAARQRGHNERTIFELMSSLVMIMKKKYRNYIIYHFFIIF